MMESKNEIESAKEQIHWNVKEAETASDSEMNAFWKQLRHFYRTGEKPDIEVREGLTTVLTDFINVNESKYPYQLEKAGGLSIDLNEQTPFLMLNQLLDTHQEENRKRFKSRLQELIIGLNRLLEIDDKISKTKKLSKTFDFADELIAFDQMVEIIPKRTSKIISEAHSDRLHKTLSSLQDGLNQYHKSNATIIIEKGLRRKITIEDLFSEAILIEGQEDAFMQTQKLFMEQIEPFTELIKAYRIAALEIAEEYQPDIHDEYFEHFTWHRLLADELNLFHPIVLLSEHTSVFNHLTSFSKLLASNQPINLIVINQQLVTSFQNDLSWEDASHQFRQELAAIVISHRNVYTFQSGMDDPDYIEEGLSNCLKSISPGICHLSMPKQESISENDPFLISAGATMSRYFPKVLYDPNKSSEWSKRFDFDSNIQAKEIWPLYSLVVQTSEQSEATIDVAFTYADYKALYPSKSSELMLIPSKYYNEHLVPLNDYMELKEQQLYGKIPYIWLIDDQRQLHRAVVPNVWVVSCQERMDYWCFLQEMGGISSNQVNSRMLKNEEAIQKAIEATTTALEAKHEKDITKIHEEAIAKAAERLIAGLLDDEDITIANSVKSSDQIENREIEDDNVIIEAPVETQKANDVETDVLDEAFLESENCTSCNECTDQYPNLFKYNEDKLAYLTDPALGTYEELVKAAEKCPAACIHPGMPINKSEPKLEALIKRASKFN